ncbi:MAG: ornithine cyclodeaminase family protein, partial [Chloroflexota bacterium]
MEQSIMITYLGGPDIKKIALTPAEIIDAIEKSLVAQGNGETVIEPRAHLMPNPTFNGHFNVLRGYI